MWPVKGQKCVCGTGSTQTEKWSRPAPRASGLGRKRQCGVPSSYEERQQKYKLTLPVAQRHAEHRPPAPVLLVAPVLCPPLRHHWREEWGSSIQRPDWYAECGPGHVCLFQWLPQLRNRMTIPIQRYQLSAMFQFWSTKKLGLEEGEGKEIALLLGGRIRTKIGMCFYGVP
jgi:hypothetical protein